MPKLSNYLIIGGLGTFLCLYPLNLRAESIEEIGSTEEVESLNDTPSTDEEAVTSYSEIEEAVSTQEDILLEQNQLSDSQTYPRASQEERPTGQGKSILNVNKPKPRVDLKTPKTSLEAKKLGWKQKTIKAPQPVSGLIKEVPMEIKEKKARLEKRQQLKEIREKKQRQKKR